MLCVLQHLPVLDGLALLLQVLERLDQEAAGAAGRDRGSVSPSRGSMTSTMNRTTARGV